MGGDIYMAQVVCVGVLMCRIWGERGGVSRIFGLGACVLGVFLLLDTFFCGGCWMLLSWEVRLVLSTRQEST